MPMPMGDYEKMRLQKSVPGERAGIRNLSHTYTHCKNLPQRVVADNPQKVYTWQRRVKSVAQITIKS
jgi:hypothetical protein